MKTFIFILLTLLSSTLFAQQVLPWKKLMNQYHQTKLKQFDADENLQAFESYLKTKPDDALAQLYTASSYCFVGRDAWMPWTKIGSVNKCIDEMEIAFVNSQAQYPADSSHRLNSYLTLGLTSIALPSSFGQHELAISSLTQATMHPEFELLPSDLKANVLNSIKE